MSEHDLDALLAAIDTPADAPADAEERVWQSLRSQLFADSVASTADADDSTVVELDRSSATLLRGTNDAPSRRRMVQVLLAAALVVALAGVAAVLLADRAEDVRIADAPRQAEPEPADRPEACLRFRLGSPMLDDLEAAITADPTTAPDLIEQTRDGLDQLRIDLEAVRSLDVLTGSQTFPNLDGALNQARLFLRTGDVDAARQAIDFAQSTYARSELAADRCLG